MAPPFKVAEFDILYGHGISREGSILDLAANNKIISKTGSWYSYGDIRMAQGRDNARTFLCDNPELCAEIEAKVRSVLFAPTAPAEEKAEPAPAPAVQEELDVF